MNHVVLKIELPLGELDKRIGMYALDCFVCPTSGRSRLVSKMVSVINSYTSHEMGRVSFELVKKAPTGVYLCRCFVVRPNTIPRKKIEFGLYSIGGGEEN